MVNVFGERGGSWDCIHRLGVGWEVVFSALAGSED